MDLQSALLKVGILAMENDNLAFQNQQLEEQLKGSQEETLQLQSELNEAVEAAVFEADKE